METLLYAVRSTEIFFTTTNRHRLSRLIYSLRVRVSGTLVTLDPHPWPCDRGEQPSSGTDADAGEELGAGEADGQDIGVRGSDRWRLGEYEDHDDRWANRWRDDRADQGRRGVGRRGDMAVPYRNDSQAEVPDRQPSLAAGTQRPLAYCKLY